MRFTNNAIVVFLSLRHHIDLTIDEYSIVVIIKKSLCQMEVMMSPTSPPIFILLVGKDHIYYGYVKKGKFFVRSE